MCTSNRSLVHVKLPHSGTSKGELRRRVSRSENELSDLRKDEQALLKAKSLSMARRKAREGNEGLKWQLVMIRIVR